MSHIAEPRPCSSPLQHALSLLPSLASLFLSRLLSHILSCCDAYGPRETGSQHKDWHSLCLNDTLHYGRRITCLRGVAGSGVTRMDAILAQTSFQLPPPLFHLHMHFKSSACVYLCPPQNYTGTTPKLRSHLFFPFLPLPSTLLSSAQGAAPLINRGNLCLWY